MVLKQLVLLPHSNKVVFSKPLACRVFACSVRACVGFLQALLSVFSQHCECGHLAMSLNGSSSLLVNPVTDLQSARVNPVFHLKTALIGCSFHTILINKWYSLQMVGCLEVCFVAKFLVYPLLLVFIQYSQKYVI